MVVGKKSNNDACEGLSHFEGRCRVIVRQCVLRGNAKNYRGYLLLSACPHPVFFSKVTWCCHVFRNVRSFYKGCDKMCFVLMIDIYINSSENHMLGFLDGILFTSFYGCIFECIFVWEFIQNRVTLGGIFG